MITVRLRKVSDQIYWSSCPSKYMIEKLREKGVSTVVNLTYECVDYNLPSSMELFHFPIIDFSFVPPEEALIKFIDLLHQKLLQGEKILIHCVGGIGRSGTAVAMLLVYHYDFSPQKALDTVYTYGGGPQSNIQRLVFNWFSRNLEMFGKENLLKMIRHGYQNDLSKTIGHASTVANISVDLLGTLSTRYTISNDYLKTAYVSGLFHDIAKHIDEKGHHELAAKMVLGWDFIKEFSDILLVSKAIYYHRGNTSLLEDKELKEMGLGSMITAAVVRLADSFGDIYSGNEVYSGAQITDDKLLINGIPRSMKRLTEKSKPLKILLNLDIGIEYNPSDLHRFI